MTGYISWFYLSFFKSMTETWHLVKLRLFDHHLSFLVFSFIDPYLKICAVHDIKMGQSNVVKWKRETFFFDIVNS